MGIDHCPVTESEVWQAAEHGQHPSHFRLINAICCGHPDLVSCGEPLSYQHYGPCKKLFSCCSVITAIWEGPPPPHEMTLITFLG